ncbi:hypothetical protein BC938DRAFT_484271 [Jimgerdemannia flammicorona]|uniref:Uncharacterized protein n=1 Tax=Jimgerdemannia flammicorona TaxID=994334 RepID=A0A433QA87_9FUNG|nr:hypothetical protein BC938DRAFT_484271 [Jimgerdemannia flammicorona]
MVVVWRSNTIGLDGAGVKNATGELLGERATSGKTTTARLIAQITRFHFVEVDAAMHATADVKQAFEEARSLFSINNFVPRRESSVQPEQQGPTSSAVPSSSLVKQRTRASSSTPLY